MESSKFYIGLGGQLVDEDLEVIGNQRYFLLALKEVIIEVIDEIMDIYRRFEKLCDSFGNESNKFLEFGTNEIFDSLWSDLEEWASRWFINEEWVKNDFFMTLKVWYENEKNKYTLYSVNPAVKKAADLAEKVNPQGKLEIPAFNPFFQTEKDYRQMMERIITKHINSTTNALEEYGYKPSAEKRVQDHYIWFVHYHVLGWSFDKIADKFIISKAATVGKEVNKIYSAIGLKKENRKKRK